MAKDPVCGTRIDEQNAMQFGLTTEHLKHTFCFCSVKCKARFDEEPGAFAEQFNEWEEWDIPDHAWNPE